MNALVSVIVPCYNMEAYLEETLRSIVASTYRPLEVLAVDDGSTDGSCRVAEAFFQSLSVTSHPDDDLECRVIRQPNSGVSVARNTGLQQAKGMYILPVDADDLISADFVSHAVKALAERPERKVVYCQAEFFGDRTGQWRLPAYSPRLLARKNMIPATALYRREDALRVGGYATEELFREDWDFWLSLLENGGEVLRLDEIGFYYRIRGGSRRHVAAEQKRRMVDAINRRHPEYMRRQLGGPLRYHRSWSRLINLFYSEKLIGPISLISPIGSIIHSGRNTLYEHDGLVIKVFQKPGFVKALLYGWFLKSKARRSYEYAQRLLQLGVATPEPVGYKEARFLGLLRESCYVSKKSLCGHTFNELIAHPSFPNREAILRSIGQFTAKMHESGALHQDYSGGNILFDEAGRVEVVDLNRIRWQKQIDWRTGCKNFERLNIDREALRVMATAYAEARGLDAEQCVRYVIDHRWWKHVRQGVTNL